MKLHGTTMRGLERTALSVGLLCGMTFGLSGCRHRQQIAPLPPIQTPVELEEIPPPANPPELEMPTEKLPALPTASAAAKQKKERKKVVAKAAPTPAPAQVVSAGPESEAAAIGALTAGEEASPKTKQDAAELISSIEKRLNMG